MATTAEIFHFLLNQQRDAAGILEYGSVIFYEAGTSNLKTVYTDRLKTTEAANPATLSQLGTVAVYGDGTYRVVVRDSNDVVVHDYPAIELAFVANNLSTVVASCEAAQLAAETAETNAETAETNAEAALASFEDVYHGSLASEPTTNVDIGDLYHNSTDGYMYVCSSIGPIVFDKIDPAAYTHPSYAGDDFSSDTGALTGTAVVSDIDINVSTDTFGHVTDANCSIATRNLALTDFGVTASAADINGMFPSGTRLVFPQAAAPTGWTKVTGLSGHGINIVDGTGGGTGGSSDAFGSHLHTIAAHSHSDTFSVASHTLTIAEMPAHSHEDRHGYYASNDFYDASHAYGSNGSWASAYASWKETGGGGGHTHGLSGAVSSGGPTSSGSFAPKYVNSVLCAKD